MTPEPARDSILRDMEGDLWEYVDGGWHQHPLCDETQQLEWPELNYFYGPITEFKATGVI